ncbi:M13 family metallopeptidase [Spiroplasma endosymbiont of Aspidapion aeneum]|uniref:M13 family metallopeptidase n=1 Tax=Spiroplasma endosymbiont of Aspidapion aeneum TaxID=3066276 RepID=UPI00313B598D
MNKIKPNMLDDFYNHVNYNYFKKAKIPKGHSRWASYYQLSDENKKKLKKLIFSKDRIYSDVEFNKVYNFFDLVLKSKPKKNKIVNSVMLDLSKILDLKSMEELTDVYIHYFKNLYQGFLISFGVYPDAKDSNKNIVYLESDGLLMSNRDYYFDDDEQTKKIRTAYFKYLKDMLSVFGLYTPERVSDTHAIEKALAENILKNEEYRDPYVTYNVVKTKDIKNISSIFEWNKIFKTLGIDNQKVVSIAEIKYFNNLDKTLKNFSFKQIKNYLISMLLVDIAGMYGLHKVGKINFEFSKVFTGIKKPKKKRDSAYDITESLLGDVIGKIFVKEWFSQEKKDEVLKMTNLIIEDYKEMMNNNNWMSSKAKEKANTKLDKLTIKIGFPDVWKDYSELEIKSIKDGGTIFNTILSVSKWQFDKAIKDLNKPVDKAKWFMNAQTVNAYYNPSSNEICFPAGILQPPFYSDEFDIEKKYAAIGSVIGHEISHAFDDQGCEYDEKGNLSKWWDKNDYKKYAELSEKLVQQFSNYEIHGSKVNGRLTLGENIADLVGLTAALRVAKKQKNNLNYKMFFEYFAEAERVISKKDALLSQIKSDPHSPSQFRVNGVLTNIREFQETYEITEEFSMYRKAEDLIKIF